MCVRPTCSDSLKYTEEVISEFNKTLAENGYDEGLRLRNAKKKNRLGGAYRQLELQTNKLDSGYLL